MRVPVVMVLMLLVLAGCGGRDEPADAPRPSASSAVPTTATPTGPVTPTGIPAPEALSRFRCEKNAAGVWGAVGYLANTGTVSASFQVTVLVGPADGSEHEAGTKRVAAVAPHGSLKFALPRLPVTGGATTCSVQVLRIR